MVVVSRVERSCWARSLLLVGLDTFVLLGVTAPPLLVLLFAVY